MTSAWTPERRVRQAALIRTWRPWDQSTGPRTAEGKAKAAGNAERFHGWTAELKAERQTVRELRALVEERPRHEHVFLNRCGQPTTRFNTDNALPGLRDGIRQRV